jgi:hypothetical protein
MLAGRGSRRRCRGRGLCGGRRRRAGLPRQDGNRNDDQARCQQTGSHRDRPDTHSCSSPGAAVALQLRSITSLTPHAARVFRRGRGGTRGSSAAVAWRSTSAPGV